MTFPSREGHRRGAIRTGLLVALAALAILATACSGSSGSGSDDAAAPTTTVPGAELQGTWSVDFTLDPTAANDAGDTDSVLDTFHETWVFTETADGCEPGDAGCLLNSRDDGTVGNMKSVDVDGNDYITDLTVPDERLCDGDTTGSTHSIRRFSVDDSGQLTGTFHQVTTADDPAACGTFDATYTFVGTIQEEGSTATTIASAGAELQGTWTVEADLVSATSAGEAVPTDGLPADTLHSEDSWTFTATADGCQPGEAGCVQVSNAGDPIGAPQAVDVAGQGFEVTFSSPTDSVCDGFPGTVDTTWTFDVDASGQLTGEERSVGTADDTTCPGSDITWSITGTLDEGAPTTTTSAPTR